MIKMAVKTNYYYWEDVLSDHTDGCIFGFADNVDELKSLVAKTELGYEMIMKELTKSPDIIAYDAHVDKKFIKIYWGGM